jgi:hypothetical protein
MNLDSKASEIPFSSFLYVALAGHLVFGIPAIIGILLLKLLEVKTLILITVLVAIIAIPCTAALAWLISKGSNWVNTPVAITATFSLPARFYPLLFGGFLGFRLFGMIGGIIVMVLFYLLAMVITIPLGKFVSRKVIPELK